MSDTPRTDAHREAMETEDFDVELAKTYTHAETLERESADLRDDLNLTRKHLREANRGAECNAKVSQSLAEQLNEARNENAAQKAALAKASASLSAFLGFHAEALPLEAMRELSELVKEIQPLIKP